MTMSADLLLLCLALAALGIVLLVLVLRALLRTARSRWLIAAAVLTAALLWIDIVILWCLVEYTLFAVDFSSDGLHALLERAGPWAPAASIGLMTAHSFVPFPAEVIAIANGVAFGTWLGVMLTWAGAMIGALLSYEIARALGPAARSRLVPLRYQARLDAFVSDSSISTLLTARLIPIMSFNLVNYAAGLAGVPRWTFVWTTGVGILPLTVLSVLLGSQALHFPAYIWILAGIAALILFGAARLTRSRVSYENDGRRAESETRNRRREKTTR